MVPGDSQSTLPQAQAAGLAADPSDTAHGACLLHRFSDCLQNMPVVLGDSQSTLPQAQDSELAAKPSDTEQVGGREHVLLEAVQVLNGAQSTLLQAHGTKLAEDPSDTSHAGILRHWFLLK